MYYFNYWRKYSKTPKFDGSPLEVATGAEIIPAGVSEFMFRLGAGCVCDSTATVVTEVTATLTPPVVVCAIAPTVPVGVTGVPVNVGALIVGGVPALIVGLYEAPAFMYAWGAEGVGQRFSCRSFRPISGKARRSIRRTRATLNRPRVEFSERRENNRCRRRRVPNPIPYRSIVGCDCNRTHRPESAPYRALPFHWPD